MKIQNLWINRKRKVTPQDDVLQKKLKQNVSYVDCLKQFLKIFDDPVMVDFLQFDKCFLLADNYLISMCFVYLHRSQMPLKDYNIINFFGALSLAHSVEEDSEHLKDGILPWMPGDNIDEKDRLMRDTTIRLWKDLDMRCLVSQSVCLEVMEIIPNHSIWLRKREHDHKMLKCGRNNGYVKNCSKCEFDHYPRYQFYTPYLRQKWSGHVQDSDDSLSVMNSDGDYDITYSNSTGEV